LADKNNTSEKEFPNHVAIIMDGNGRWASARKLPRAAGHHAGLKSLRKTITAASEIGLKFLTVYSFSSENWSRPQDEVKHLFALLRRFMKQDVAALHEKNIKIRIIGLRNNLSADILEMIESCQNLTRNNTGMTFVIAFNYGARQEIVEAARDLANLAKNGELNPDDITEDVLASKLSTHDIPDPDLLIRTGGEQRLSNYLLWQCAYTEFVFVPEYWPQFGESLLVRAIDDYQNRDRRFGGLKLGTG